MKRAVSLAHPIIGIVTFSRNTLFVQEQEEPAGVLSESFISAAGTNIVYEAAHYSPAITLLSKNYGYIDDAQRIMLISMYGSIGSTCTLTYNDALTETVRFDRSKSPVFRPIYEGAEIFTATIPLVKVS